MQYMALIPMVFHFAYYRGTTNWAWRDIHTLCLLTCKRYTGATKIVVHYDREGEGEWWEKARALGGIEWRQSSFTPTIAGHAVTDQRIICDVFRLQTLWEEGGFFCDLDFVFIKSFETFRDAQAVIGTQCPQKRKLACGLMGCVPGSTFIRAYLDSYQTWDPTQQKHWWIYANIIPWNLSTQFPVMVLKRPTFYPVTWTNKTFWKGEKVSLKNAHAVHLWETLKPNLTVQELRQTILLPYLEEVLDDRPHTVAQFQGEAIIHFD